MRGRAKGIERGQFFGIFAGLALLGALGCRRETAPPEPTTKAATSAARSTPLAAAPSAASPASSATPVVASALASAPVPTASVEPSASASAASDELPPKPESNHRVGPLSLGLSAKDVEAALGAPKKKSKPLVEEATGSAIVVWSYPERGLSLTFARAEEKEPWRLERFTAEAPSDLRTDRNVGVGSARKDVEKAYEGKFAEDAPPTEERVVIDSIYGGVLFTFHEGKVASIFVGAAAE